VNCYHKAHFIASHPDQAARDNDDDTDIEEIPLTTLTADEWNRIPGDAVTFTRFIEADDNLVLRETQDR